MLSEGGRRRENEAEKRGGGQKLTFSQQQQKNFFLKNAVVFYARSDAEDAVKYLSGAVLDERPIRVDFDWGFVEGRQYGRCVFVSSEDLEFFFGFFFLPFIFFDALSHLSRSLSLRL